MCMGGYSIRLEGLEDPGFCSHLGVRMEDGRNGLRATAANTTTTPSGKSPSGRCPRGFRLPRSHRTRMTERGGVSGVFAGWIFRQLSSTATAKHWQPAQASVVSIAGDTITTSLPLASQMSSRAASAASKASLSDHHGRVDDSNGIFYCFECWALFEDGADYAGGAAQSTHGTTAAPVSARHRLLLLSMLKAGQSAGHTVQSIAVHEEIAQFGNTRQRCRVRCSWSLTVRLLLFRRPGQRRGRPEAAARTTREDCKLLLFMNPCQSVGLWPHGICLSRTGTAASAFCPRGRRTSRSRSST